MSFWAGSRLKDRIEREQLVAPYSADRVDSAAYTLRLGAYAFTTTDSSEEPAGTTVAATELKERQQIAIPPGQFAFLLTEETVTVPADAIAFISLKTGRKFEGLINVSGFHVDPGWSSRLIFGVLNAGPSPIILERGQLLFLLFFADLSAVRPEPFVADLENVYGGAKGKYSNIPPELVQKMSGPVPSLYRLNKVTKDLEASDKDLQATARYAQLVSYLSLGLSTAALSLVIGLAVKALFLSPTSASPSAADGTQLQSAGQPGALHASAPSVSVLVAPDCASTTCATSPKTDGSPNRKPNTGQDTH